MAGLSVFQSKGVVVGCFLVKWMLLTGSGVLVFPMELASGIIQSWICQLESSSCSSGSGSTAMLDLAMSGFIVDFEDRDFLEDLDDLDFFEDLDDFLDDFFELVFERWLSPGTSGSNGESGSSDGIMGSFCHGNQFVNCLLKILVEIVPVTPDTA